MSIEKLSGDLGELILGDVNLNHVKGLIGEVFEEDGTNIGRDKNLKSKLQKLGISVLHSTSLVLNDDVLNAKELENESIPED
ncbi:MAG: hypothetical protein AAFR66_23840, partial [Bacteroidota bacterium]